MAIREFEVVLTRTPEGYAISCPALFGCHSQGDTEAEALANIGEAIAGWLESDARQSAARKAEILADGKRYGFPTTTSAVRLPQPSFTQAAD